MRKCKNEYCEGFGKKFIVICPFDSHQNTYYMKPVNFGNTVGICIKVGCDSVTPKEDGLVYCIPCRHDFFLEEKKALGEDFDVKIHNNLPEGPRTHPCETEDCKGLCLPFIDLCDDCHHKAIELEPKFNLYGPMPTRTNKQHLLDGLNSLENTLLIVEALVGDDSGSGVAGHIADLKSQYLKIRGYALELQDKPKDTK